MIYDFPEAQAPIRQGDIFFTLPLVEVANLDSMLSYGEAGVVEDDWESVSTGSTQSLLVLPVRSVIGIVISQDCDLVRARDVTLCEVRVFKDVERKASETVQPNSWRKMLTQQARLNLKWFYLPPDDRLGLTEKMAADFQRVFSVPRADLEKRRDKLRKGRLNDLSEAHFRERVSEFFRRYPYDEWYPLNSAEMEAYSRDYPEAAPFPWQSKP